MKWRCFWPLCFLLGVSYVLAQDVPSSPRSREALRRSNPELRKALSRKGFTWGSPVFIRIFKEEQALEVWLKDGNAFRQFKSFRVCTYGEGGLGPKTAVGDGRAPEGFYYVAPRQMNPHSRYHLAFNLGYPNAYDRAHGSTGSALMVHGKCVSIGCFAMTDSGIEEIYALTAAALRNGQPFFRVHIFPFRMSPERMEKYAGAPWVDFWKNLEEGYRLFEENRCPPGVRVRQGRYVFEPACPAGRASAAGEPLQ